MGGVLRASTEPLQQLRQGLRQRRTEGALQPRSRGALPVGPPGRTRDRTPGGPHARLPRRIPGLPECLGTAGRRPADLRRGAMVPARRLLLVSALAFLCGAAAPPPSTARLRIELRLAGGASPAAAGKVTLRLIPQAVGTAAAPAPLAREVEAPGSVEVAASSEIAWRVEVDAPRLWSAPQVVPSDPARPDRSLTLDLVPAGQLTGRIEPPPGEPPPPSPIELRLEPVVPARGPSARRAGP